MTIENLDAGTEALLARYGFDLEQFETLRARVAAGDLSPPPTSSTARSSRRTTGTSYDCPSPAPRMGASLAKPASRRFEAGRVAQIVLAGGMATRFGGVVKGAVEALDGRSFLSWKLGETARLADDLGVDIPVALMTSFSTDDETRAHVAALGRPRAALVLTVDLAPADRDGRPVPRVGGAVAVYAGSRRPAGVHPPLGHPRRIARARGRARGGLERRQPRRATRPGA